MSRQELLSIGRFARVTGLTVKALRHYGALGVLEPAHVDPESGYRFYRRDQVQTARAIFRLRALDVPIPAVDALLRAAPDAQRERLIAHRANLEQRAARLQRILAELTRLIDRKEELVPEPADVLYELNIREYEEQSVLAIRERVPADHLPQVIPAAYQELFRYLGEVGVEAVEPGAITVCPFPDAEGMVEVENTVVLASRHPGRGRIEGRTLEACTAICLTHRGPYTELSRSYDALSRWIEEASLETAGSPREIYWTDPQATPDPADYVTEIAWPIVADRGKLEAATRRGGRRLTRPLPAL